jgi:predicted nucleic acid-binding protein
LLDTNVVSELTKPRPAKAVRAWVEATPEDLIYLSVITIGEVRKGIDLLDDSDPRRAPLQAWLERDLRLRFTAGSSRLMIAWPSDGGRSRHWPGSII